MRDINTDLKTESTVGVLEINKLLMSLFAKMASPQKVVLLACGSFNPPTNMHLRMFGMCFYRSRYFHKSSKILGEKESESWT